MNTFREILARYWGHTEFRPMQEDIIRSVWEGKDTLGLMPTGGGKSITFQVPAMAKEGICLVVTPLIALMRDQADDLSGREINAVAIHSGMTREEIDINLDNCIYGNVKFLYVSPERLQTEIFRIRVQKMNVNLIAVDEAHCVSQWGYDFRPSYLKIPELRELLPEIPVLALTASATPNVVEDIMDKLRFREKNVFRKSFERKNIIYTVEHAEDKFQRILKTVEENKGSGIIYVRNRKETKDLAMFLQRNSIKADYYHAGLTHEDRNQRQDEWQKGKTRIIAATNAFGLGINKPDVRFVIHLDLPDSPEAYYQEAGRAGRDEKKANAILLYNGSDKKSITQRIATSFPDISIIKQVYHSLGNYLQIPIGGGKSASYDFILNEFISRYKYNAITAHNSLNILQREGYIEVTDELNNPSRVHFKIQRDDLYKFQVANERFDGFIKLVLRSYSGMFSSYVAIDENLLARRSGISVKDVYGFLNRLSSLGIISYIPRKKNPVIVFTEERLDEKNLRFSVETYKFLKERYIERAEEVLRYAASGTICRSQMLLTYFGEKSARRCGQCDVCLDRNHLGMSDFDFEVIQKELKLKLESGHLRLDEAIKNIHHPEEKVIIVFKWLSEHGKIKKDEKYLYYWSE